MLDLSNVLTQLLLLALLSLPGCVYFASRRMSAGDFLPYTPRWPVPWGAMGAFLAVAIVVLGMLDQMVASAPADEVAAARVVESSENYIQKLLLGGAMSLGLVALMGWVLSRAVGATLADLGLPTSREQFWQDMRLGALATLASLLPVYALQLVVVEGLGLETEHPILVLVSEQPSVGLLLAMSFAAVIVTPVFEEFVFRLLFQGWLERIEDEALALAGKLRVGKAKEETEEEPTDASATYEEALADPESPYASPFGEQTPEVIRRLRGRKGAPPVPPEITVAGLPHGWGPILISSFVFAMMHLNQGSAPFGLFVFALTLGYLYQRTHRVTPSIAAHMTFNLISVVLVWLASLAS